MPPILAVLLYVQYKAIQYFIHFYTPYSNGTTLNPALGQNGTTSMLGYKYTWVVLAQNAGLFELVFSI